MTLEFISPTKHWIQQGVLCSQCNDFNHFPEISISVFKKTKWVLVRAAAGTEEAAGEKQRREVCEGDGVITQWEAHSCWKMWVRKWPVKPCACKHIRSTHISDKKSYWYHNMHSIHHLCVRRTCCFCFFDIKKLILDFLIYIF